MLSCDGQERSLIVGVRMSLDGTTVLCFPRGMMNLGRWRVYPFCDRVLARATFTGLVLVASTDVVRWVEYRYRLAGDLWMYSSSGAIKSVEKLRECAACSRYRISPDGFVRLYLPYGKITSLNDRKTDGTNSDSLMRSASS
jgi:hypothetical protein